LALSASGKAGYRAASSNQIIEIDECPILEEGLEQRLQHLPMSELEPNLSVKPLSAAEWNLRWTQPTIRLGDWEYIVSPSSFFQANTAVAALLVEQVLAALQLHGDEHILDLYSGVGLFTLPIASQAARVIGVESNPAAAQDAQRNLAHYPNVEIITAEVAQALQTGLLQQKWDAVILDPPRAGVDHAAMRQICALQTCRLVYVSCNPATLARDIKILCANGYVLEYAQPLDMFPQTHHVETAAFLERR
jgi:23S rRNA (uracil1939-C5)-methyltransferase